MKNIYYILTSVILLMTSCSNEEIPNEGQKVPMNIASASIMSLQTKSTNMYLGSTVAIAVKNGASYPLDYSYYKYNYFTADGVIVTQDDPSGILCWRPTNNRPAYISTSNDLIAAISPVNQLEWLVNNGVNLHEMPTAMHSEREGNYGRDICVDKDVSISVRNPYATLTMKHLYSSIEFKIKCGAGFKSTNKELNEIKLVGEGLINKCNYSFSTFGWQQASEENKGYATASISETDLANPNFDSNNDQTNDATKVQILLPPCSLTQGNTYKLLFKIGDVDYSTTLTTLPSENKFKENFKYSVDVLFDGKSIIISNFVIENWAPNPLNTTPIIPTPIKTPVN